MFDHLDFCLSSHFRIKKKRKKRKRETYVLSLLQDYWNVISGAAVFQSFFIQKIREYGGSDSTAQRRIHSRNPQGNSRTFKNSDRSAAPQNHYSIRMSYRMGARTDIGSSSLLVARPMPKPVEGNEKRYQTKCTMR